MQQSLDMTCGDMDALWLHELMSLGLKRYET